MHHYYYFCQPVYPHHHGDPQIFPSLQHHVHHPIEYIYVSCDVT